MLFFSQVSQPQEPETTCRGVLWSWPCWCGLSFSYQSHTSRIFYGVALVAKIYSSRTIVFFSEAVRCQSGSESQHVKGQLRCVFSPCNAEAAERWEDSSLVTFPVRF